MIYLPSLQNKTKEQPNRPEFEETYYIPDMDNYSDFWKNIYKFLRGIEFRSPVLRDVMNYINNEFGYFGYRVHPVTHTARYFHKGISLDLKCNRNIYPIHPGVLEYSGYGAINGYYVLLSHPDIVTEDGYVLHTMYCHLKKPLVKFNSYQKMLREISLGSHPIIPVNIKTVLGTAATSGTSREQYPGLYLECSFRKLDKAPIVFDPLQLYYPRARRNITSEITDLEEIKELFERK